MVEFFIEKIYEPTFNYRLPKRNRMGYVNFKAEVYFAGSGNFSKYLDGKGKIDKEKIFKDFLSSACGHHIRLS